MILTDNVSSLRINEFESNPPGQDSGAEWVELYSEENVNLEGYLLENGDGGIYNLSGIFSGYLVVTFSSLWLDNNNETVYLKLNENIIDEVGPFADSKNNNQTHSFCDGEWKFVSSSREGVNSCSSSTSTQTNPPAQQTQNNNEEEDDIVVQEPVNNNFLLTVPTIETKQEPNKKILLSKNKPNYEVTRTYKTRVGVIYFFIGFCVFLVVLIVLRKL